MAPLATVACNHFPNLTFDLTICIQQNHLCTCVDNRKSLRRFILLQFKEVDVYMNSLLLYNLSLHFDKQVLRPLMCLRIFKVLIFLNISRSNKNVAVDT